MWKYIATNILVIYYFYLVSYLTFDIVIVALEILLALQNIIKPVNIYNLTFKTLKHYTLIYVRKRVTM